MNLYSHLKFFPSKVCPNCQFRGATCQAVDVLPSTARTLKVRDCPTSIASVSHFWPHSRFIAVHGVLLPFTSKATTSPAPPTFHTSTWLKNDPSLVILGQPVKNWLSDVEVLAWRVAPPSVVAGLIIIRRTKVGGSDLQRRLSRLTPLGIVHALDLVTGATGLAIVEQHGAQSCRLEAVSFLHYVLVPASST